MSTLIYRFPDSLIDLYGESGREWVRRLPETLAELSRRWSLHILPPFNGLSYNYAAPAVGPQGKHLVLKMGLPGSVLVEECAALEWYGGRGAVRLLQADLQVAVLLLERLEPGTPLRTVQDDDQATRIAAGVMQQLWRALPPEHAFKTTETLANELQRLRKTFDGGCGPFSAHLVEKAEILFTELLASQGPPVLLHGDLHHDNILASGDSWRAIDPQGYAGEAAYEVGALLRNPLELMEAPELAPRTGRRLDILAETLGLSRQRMLQWSLAQAVLSAWWDYEDHQFVHTGWMRLAQVLDELNR